MDLVHPMELVHNLTYGEVVLSVMKAGNWQFTTNKRNFSIQ